MSTYKLETPRPRPPPLPLRSQNFNAKSSSPRLSGAHNSPSTLLYDLPPTLTPSPTRAKSSFGIASPTSPTGGNRSRGPANRMTSPVPPGSAGSRAATPAPLIHADQLEQFAERCRAWYYDQDDNAGRLMTQTLATLPPSQRAPFARLQASIRTAYHASVNARRNAEFQAHLSATQPGGSLMPHSRADPKGLLARKERYERLERFVRTWCTIGMPGTKPFFEGLWAVIRLQVIPEHLGGAGGRRIEWEIDDAVFKEAAGKDFMLDAIDVLKGALGFEEAPSSRRTNSAPSSPFPSVSRAHSRSQSQPLSSEPSAPVRSLKVPPIISTTMPKRTRAPSDPFIDTPQLSASYSSANTAVQLSTSGSSTIDEPSTPRTPRDDPTSYFSPSVGRQLPDLEECFRVWTAPDLSDPEYLGLLKAFPAFVARHPLPTFPIKLKSRRHADVEEGIGVMEERRDIRVGTGTMWVGDRSRSPGWQGSWWTRFKLWWRRLFC